MKRLLTGSQKTERICIMKHDKRRGVVVMDKSKYTEKGLKMLQTEKHTKLRHDLTKSIKSKIQR